MKGKNIVNVNNNQPSFGMSVLKPNTRNMTADVILGLKEAMPELRTTADTVHMKPRVINYNGQQLYAFDISEVGQTFLEKLKSKILPSKTYTDTRFEVRQNSDVDSIKDMWTSIAKSVKNTHLTDKSQKQAEKANRPEAIKKLNAELASEKIAARQERLNNEDFPS